MNWINTQGNFEYINLEKIVLVRHQYLNFLWEVRVHTSIPDIENGIIEGNDSGLLLTTFETKEEAENYIKKLLDL